MKMNINKKLFKDRDLVLAKQFILQKPNATINKLIEIIGFELFAQVLLCPQLTGKHIVFPTKSTLERMVVINKVKEELRGFKKGGDEFNRRAKKLGAELKML